MIVDALLFPVFVFFLNVLGLGTLRPSKIEDYPLYYYPIIGLLTLGFLSVFINFFIGVASPIYYFIIAVITLLGAFRLSKKDFRNYFWVVALSIVLTPLVANMDPGSDSGLYHLPHQLWIRSEKIVFGLANFQTRFGFSSMLEYIDAPLWIEGHFKLLAYVMGAFFVVLLLFLSYLLRSSLPQAQATGLLTTVGIMLIHGSYTDYHYTSTDTPAAILFALSFLQGLVLLIQPTPPTRRELTIFYLCTLFCLTLKASGLLIVLWAITVSGVLLYERKASFRVFVRSAVWPAALGVLWLLRGLIVSGCLFYPLVGSCLEVPWNAIASAQENSDGITAWARQPRMDLAPLTGWSWIGDWWLGEYWLFSLGLFIAILATALGYHYLCKEKLENSRSIIFSALAFLVLALSAWFIKAPTPRFGGGIFMVLPTLLALAIFGFRIRPISPKAAQAVICLFAFTLIVYPLGRAIKHDRLAFNPLRVPAIESVSSTPYFGVRPVGDICWLEPHCTPDPRPSVSKEIHGYRVITKAPVAR